MRDENKKLREELGFRYEIENVIGRSPAMQEIFATIMRAAPTRATVLLAGESGVSESISSPELSTIIRRGGRSRSSRLIALPFPLTVLLIAEQLTFHKILGNEQCN